MEAKKLRDVVQCMIEAGRKLECESETIATASMIFHNFYSVISTEYYDLHIIAATSLYIASKAIEDPLDVTDIVNVFHNILHKGSEPLKIEKQGVQWQISQSIIEAEVTVLKMVQFKVRFDLPHRYLIHYVKTMSDWLSEKTRNKFPIARTCWSILNDLYLSNICLLHDSSHVAVTILYMAMWIYDVRVPGFIESPSLKWIQILCEDMTMEKLWVIMESILAIYDTEDGAKKVAKKRRVCVAKIELS